MLDKGAEVAARPSRRLGEGRVGEHERESGGQADGGDRAARELEFQRSSPDCDGVKTKPLAGAEARANTSHAGGAGAGVSDTSRAMSAWRASAGTIWPAATKTLAT